MLEIKITTRILLEIPYNLNISMIHPIFCLYFDDNGMEELNSAVDLAHGSGLLFLVASISFRSFKSIAS